MIVPDQSHINRIRDALWQRSEGCASVMVPASAGTRAKPDLTHANYHCGRKLPKRYALGSILLEMETGLLDTARALEAVAKTITAEMPATPSVTEGRR